MNSEVTSSEPVRKPQQEDRPKGNNYNTNNNVYQFRPAAEKQRPLQTYRVGAFMDQWKGQLKVDKMQNILKSLKGVKGTIPTLAGAWRKHASAIVAMEFSTERDANWMLVHAQQNISTRVER